MNCKIKVGEMYFNKFESSTSGGTVGKAMTQLDGIVVMSSEECTHTSRSVKDCVSTIIDAMRYGDIPKEKVTIEIVED